MSFVHLHVHSMYSLLDGLSKFEELVLKSKELGMNAIALTDHGVMYGVVEFYEIAKKHGIKPIIGMEAYIAPGGIANKDKASGGKRTNHQLLLAKSTVGYKNLIKLTTIAHLEGFYYKPRIDMDILREHSEGLIGTTSCLAGEIPQLLLSGKEDEAEAKLNAYREIFGKDNYYAELQPHNIPDQIRLNELLIPFAKKHDIPLIVTNDVHYVEKDDFEAQDVLVCVQTGKVLSDNDRMKMEPYDYYLKSPDEMREQFKEYPEALENTQKIADECDIEIEFDKHLLPDFDVPEGFGQESYLINLCQKGLVSRYGIHANDKLVLESIDDETRVTQEKADTILKRSLYELSIINPMGFAPYYLMVQDLVNTARDKGIGVGPGRGSGAGSMIAYLVRITDLDPLDHGLIFERFLNPERASMPDFDLDFADDRRDEMIHYTIEKYGKDNVAQIITFGSMLAKAAIRDTGRVMGIPYSEVDLISKMIPTGFTIDQTLAEVTDFKNQYDTDPEVHQLINLSKRLEGVTRHSSTHAAAVVISKRPLVEDIPLQKDTKTGKIVTQYSKKPAEKIGLLKVDFLGLRTLTIIQNTVRNIEKQTGLKIDMSTIPIDDKSVFDMIGKGETTGVFQIESSGMIRLAKQLKPSVFGDITAMVALFRPGPMEWIDDFVDSKHGKKKPTYPHPVLEPILKDTYGVAVYQEQIQQIAQEYAGFSLGQGYILIKAIGKKIEKLLKEQKIEFVKGAMEKQGVSKEEAQKLFAFIEPFARYGFNKSHAACYAMITYQTAYLKQNYPEAFIAALLTSEMNDQDKLTLYMREANRMGIEILPPSINKSERDFSLEDGSVRFGLRGIRNVGDAVIETILSVREDGEFTSLYDFSKRVDSRSRNNKVLDSLIRSGAFDEFENRNTHLTSLSRILSAAQKDADATKNGQTSFFGGGVQEGAPNLGSADNTFVEHVPSVSQEIILQWEKELLGLYVTGHPLDSYRSSALSASLPNIELLKEQEKGVKILVMAMISELRVIMTKKGDRMAMGFIEDESGKVAMVIFPRTYAKFEGLIKEDTPLIFAVNMDMRNGDPQCIIDAILAPSEHSTPQVEMLCNKGYRKDLDRSVKALSIKISKDKATKEIFHKIRKILVRYPGEERAFIRIQNGTEKILKIPILIEAENNTLHMELEDSLGRGSLTLEREEHGHS